MCIAGLLLNSSSMATDKIVLFTSLSIGLVHVELVCSNRITHETDLFHEIF